MLLSFNCTKVMLRISLVIFHIYKESYCKRLKMILLKCCKRIRTIEYIENLSYSATNYMKSKRTNSTLVSVLFKF